MRPVEASAASGVALRLLLCAVVAVLVAGCGGSGAADSFLIGEIAAPHDRYTTHYTIGGFPLDNRIGHAGKHFGPPDSRRVHWYWCEYKWRDIGLEIDHGLDQTNTCDPTAPISSTFLTDQRWHTNRGLHVGDSVARVRELYPEATHDPGYWYLERSTVSHPGPILMVARVRSGRVSMIMLHTNPAAVAQANRIRIRMTTAGQAAAKEAVLTRSDLGSGWKGGAKKPDVSNQMGCTSYEPKQSDLTVIGAARSEWSNSSLGAYIGSYVQLLQTPRMVQLDWERTVASPKVLPCLRESLAKSIGRTGKAVSLNMVAFPRVAPLTAAWRAVIDIGRGKQKVRVVTDVIAFGRGRTEQTLTLSAAANGLPRSFEVKLARTLAGRSS